MVQGLASLIGASQAATSRGVPWRQLANVGEARRVLRLAASARRSVFLRKELTGRAPIWGTGGSVTSARSAGSSAVGRRRGGVRRGRRGGRVRGCVRDRSRGR